MDHRKLRLDLGALRVESFVPVALDGVRGTVHGNSGFYNTCNCANDSAPNWGSCGTTCQDPTNCWGYCTDSTCQESNNYSCGCPPPGNSRDLSCACPPPATTPEAGCASV